MDYIQLVRNSLCAHTNKSSHAVQCTASQSMVTAQAVAYWFFSKGCYDGSKPSHKWEWDQTIPPQKGNPSKLKHKQREPAKLSQSCSSHPVNCARPQMQACVRTTNQRKCVMHHKKHPTPQTDVCGVCKLIKREHTHVQYAKAYESQLQDVPIKMPSSTHWIDNTCLPHKCTQHTMLKNQQPHHTCNADAYTHIRKIQMH